MSVSELSEMLYAVTMVIAVSSSTRAGRRRVVTVLPASTSLSAPTSVSAGPATTGPRVNASTDVRRLRARTAPPAPTRRPPEATSAHAPPDTWAPLARSTTHAVPVARAPSASETAEPVVRRRAQDAWSCTCVRVVRDSTVRTAPSSTHARRRRVSIARPVSDCRASSTHACVRKDTTASSASDAHRVKIVPVATAPHASKPATRSTAHAHGDTTAARATKVTLVSWRRVHRVSTAVRAETLPISATPVSVYRDSTGRDATPDIIRAR